MKKMIFIIYTALFWSCNKELNKVNTPQNESKREIAVVEKPRIETDYKNYYNEAQQYCKKNNLNQTKFILIDLSIHSGLKRFFVYDFKKKCCRKIIHGKSWLRR
jgi:hypothetical protein